VGNSLLAVSVAAALCFVGIGQYEAFSAPSVAADALSKPDTGEAFEQVADAFKDARFTLFVDNTSAVQQVADEILLRAAKEGDVDTLRKGLLKGRYSEVKVSPEAAPGVVAEILKTATREDVAASLLLFASKLVNDGIYTQVNSDLATSLAERAWLKGEVASAKQLVHAHAVAGRAADAYLWMLRSGDQFEVHQRDQYGLQINELQARLAQRLVEDKTVLRLPDHRPAHTQKKPPTTD